MFIWLDYEGNVAIPGLDNQKLLRGSREKEVFMGDENALRSIREFHMLSKTEFARSAGISPITLGRIENGQPCRIETKKKILLGLGLTPDDHDRVFPSMG